MDARPWMTAPGPRVGDVVKAHCLTACVVGTAMLVRAAPSAAATVDVKMIQSPSGKTYFDPACVQIVPGDTVRWAQLSGFHSVTAYHPSNDTHKLRTLASAKPCDSDILRADFPKRDATFEHVFTVQGVYDYFCKPPEMVGIVGRIVVGHSDRRPRHEALWLRTKRALEVGSGSGAKCLSFGCRFRDHAETNGVRSVRHKRSL